MNIIAQRSALRTRLGAPPVPSGGNLGERLAGESGPDANDREEDREPSAPDRQENLDEVDEASRESFPASDPPAFTPLHIGT